MALHIFPFYRCILGYPCFIWLVMDSTRPFSIDSIVFYRDLSRFMRSRLVFELIARLAWFLHEIATCFAEFWPDFPCCCNGMSCYAADGIIMKFLDFIASYLAMKWAVCKSSGSSRCNLSVAAFSIEPGRTFVVFRVFVICLGGLPHPEPSTHPYPSIRSRLHKLHYATNLMILDRP